MRENAKLLIISLFLIFGFLLNLNSGYAWLSGWQYRKSINITNSGSTALTDYQVLITMDTQSLISAGKMRSDCGDIRFANSTDNLLSYWIESGCNTTSTKIWVKVPNIPASSNTTIYVYYGNSTATSLSNGDATFLFFDDFLGTSLNTSKWTTSIGSGGNVVVNNGLLNVSQGGSSGVLTKISSTSTFGTNVVLRARYYSNIASTTSQGIGFINSITYSTRDSVAKAMTRTWDTSPTQRTTTYNSAYEDYATDGLTTFNVWEIVRVGTTSVKFFINGVLNNTHTSQVPTGNYPIEIVSMSWGTSTPGGFITVDWVLVRKYTSPEPTSSIGAEELPNQSPQITIYLPQNQTYFYSNNFIFNFSVSDDRSTTFWVKAFLDGNLIYENRSYQNNTLVVLTQNLAQVKSYNFTIWANDTDTVYPQTSSLTVIFTIKDLEIQQITYNTNVYETTQESFSEVIRYNPDLVQGISANLLWNSTNYQTSQTQNSTHFSFSTHFYIPLVQTNNTAVNFYFANQITYTNGTTATINSQTNQQNVLFAYIPTGLSVPTNVIEMDYIPVTFTPTYYSTNADLQAYAYFRNQTVQLTPKSYGYFTGSIDALNVSSYNETYPIYANLVISFNNQTVTRSSNQTNITIYQVTLTDCSIFPTQTFSLIVKDEETTNTLTNLNYTFLRFDVTPLNNRITRTYTFENKQNICIYPAWTTYNAKIYAIARKDNYALTTHAPYTTSVLTNQTQTLTLYMLPSSYATPITFTLPDQNYILYVERGYGSNFVYIRSDTADFNKKVVIYLRPYDVYYKVKVFTPDQTLCFQSDQFKIASSTYEILSCQAGLSNYTISPMYQKIIDGNCSTYDLGNYTRVLCSFVTLDNLDHDVNLTIYKLVEPFGEIVYYQNSTHSSTGSFDVLLEKGYDYKVVMSAHSVFDYITFNVYSKILQKSAEVFTFALILFVVGAVVGFINPFAGLVMNVLIFLGLATTGVLTLQSGVIGALTLLIVVAIIFTREWR